ncbi:MAG: hypothetical protein HFH60_12900 [Lachnospiraceae bacterium]|nr:hypothetical protein [Lachnospiraceae bacterium]
MIGPYCDARLLYIDDLLKSQTAGFVIIGLHMGCKNTGKLLERECIYPV